MHKFLKLHLHTSYVSNLEQILLNTSYACFIYASMLSIGQVGHLPVKTYLLHNFQVHF